MAALTPVAVDSSSSRMSANPAITRRGAAEMVDVGMVLPALAAAVAAAAVLVAAAAVALLALPGPRDGPAPTLPVM